MRHSRLLNRGPLQVLNRAIHAAEQTDTGGGALSEADSRRAHAELRASLHSLAGLARPSGAAVTVTGPEFAKLVEVGVKTGPQSEAGAVQRPDQLRHAPKESLHAPGEAETCAVDLATEHFRSIGGIGEEMVQAEEDIGALSDFMVGSQQSAANACGASARSAMPFLDACLSHADRAESDPVNGGLAGPQSEGLRNSEQLQAEHYSECNPMGSAILNQIDQARPDCCQCRDWMYGFATGMHRRCDGSWKPPRPSRRCSRLPRGRSLFSCRRPVGSSLLPPWKLGAGGR